jgi:hypothetical protein
MAIAPGAPSTLYAGTDSGVFVYQICGNGAVEFGEQCDDGTANGTATSCCTATCTFQVLGTPCTGGTCSGTADTCGTTTTTIITTTTTSTSTTSTLPCETARCVLDAALYGGACAGQAVPGSVTTKLDRAVALIERAQSTTGKEQRHRFAKAKTKLRLAGKAVRKAAKGKNPKLTAGCPAALEHAAASVRSGLGT